MTSGFGSSLYVGNPNTMDLLRAATDFPLYFKWLIHLLSPLLVFCSHCLCPIIVWCYPRATVSFSIIHFAYNRLPMPSL